MDVHQGLRLRLLPALHCFIRRYQMSPELCKLYSANRFLVVQSLKEVKKRFMWPPLYSNKSHFLQVLLEIITTTSPTMTDSVWLSIAQHCQKILTLDNH